MEPFAARDDQRARRRPSCAQIVGRRLRVIKVHPARGVLHAATQRRLFAVARIANARGERERLQLAPFGQIAGHFGYKAIEQSFRVILAHIDDAGRRIDAGRFVVEAPHGFQRHRLDQAGRASGHFEDIAVIRKAIHRPARFLAGQPGAPWRNPARTIADRARYGSKLAFDGQGFSVEHQIGRAAGKDRAIRPARVAIGQLAASPFARRQLVVAHQRDFAAGQGETAHAIRRIGHGEAVVHRIAQLRDDAIGKTLLQIEDAVGIRHQSGFGSRPGPRLGW